MAKSHTLLKKSLKISLLVLCGLLLSGLITLYIFAEKAAHEYRTDASKEQQFISQQLAILSTTATQDQALETRIMAFKQALEQRKGPTLTPIWLGELLSPRYRTAKVASSNKGTQISSLEHLLQYYSLNKVIAARLADGTLRKNISDKNDSVAAQAGWQAFVEELRALHLYDSLSQSRDRLRQEAEALAHFFHTVSDAYTSRDRAFLEKANTELQAHLQRLQALATSLEDQARQLDNELLVAFDKKLQ